jgi:large subunit ribosomal protein L29
MSARELHQMTDEELDAKLTEYTEERFRLRFRSATESIESPIQFRTVRRNIARIKTILRERSRAEGGTDE